MKCLFALSIGMFFILGCGLENQHGLDLDPDFFGDGTNKGIYADSSSACRQSFSVSLIQLKNMGISPVIEFSSDNQNAVEARALTHGAGTEQRCTEIKNYLSAATIREAGKNLPGKLLLEIDFTLSDAERKLMAEGKSISVRPSTADLEYSDGALNEKLVSLELRCTGNFSVLCDTEEIDGQKACMLFVVNPSTQTCTFRSMSIPFAFSDHMLASLDISGELTFSAAMGAYLKFSKISWDGLY